MPRILAKFTVKWKQINQITSKINAKEILGRLWLVSSKMMNSNYLSLISVQMRDSMRR